MDDFDLDQFENTAAWLEYCEGLTRFQAETEAARRQGVKRHEAIRMGHSAKPRDHREAPQRHAAHDLPRMQPAQAKQEGSVLVRDVQAGRDNGVLPSLPVVNGGVL
jgi:hypothetical protein